MMAKELISKATRNEFREVLTGFVLREINMIFESAGLSPRRDFDPQGGGQRRSLVEQYYANVDFTNASEVRKVVAAYEELMLQLNAHPSQWADDNRHKEVIQKLLSRMERDGFRYERGHFTSDALHAHALAMPSLIALSRESISEHIEKARAKIAAGDAAGAITNTYSLVEAFLKEILRQTNTSFKENEGDIRPLYNSAADALNLNPKGEHLESHLKTILQGLKSLVVGLYEVANKASDRHARRYNPAPHHAKLAVNTAVTLCEFLLDSFAYQQTRASRKVST
jgi:hypothetical protein